MLIRAISMQKIDIKSIKKPVEIIQQAFLL